MRVLICLFLLAASASAERIPLTVDFGGVETTAEHFVKGGITFARAALKSTDNARLLEDNKEVPLQVRALATWPDGSVKWLLVDFAAAAKKSYVLEFGAGITREASPAVAAVMSPAGDAVTVDTGVVRFTVKKGGCGFIDELSFDVDGDGKYSAGEKVVEAAAEGVQRNFLNYLHVENAADYSPMSHFAKGVIDRSRMRVDEIAVEESGPLRACVRIRGKYLYDAVGSTAQHPPMRANQFTVRIHAWRGSGLLRAEHTFVFEGDPDHDFVRTMGLALDSKSLVRAGAGVDALYQSSADTYEFWHAKDRRSSPDTSEHWAGGAGALSLAGANWGLVSGIRRMRELYPKGVWSDHESGRVVAYLYPPEARPLDMRRYARREYGVGEGSCYETEPGKEYPELANFSRSCSRGVGRSHDVFFSFYRAGSERAEAEDLKVADRGAVVRTPLDVMAKSRAIGCYATYKPGVYEDVWKASLKMLDYSLDAQERFKWYGFFDFGDQQSRFNYQRTGRWECDWGRWGWGNNDGLGRVSYAYAMAYLAGGDRKYYDALEAAARHNTDVDIMHTDTIIQETDAIRVRGLSHRHGVQHWSDPYMGLRGSTCVGWRLYYYLSGEERLRDVLEEVVDCAMRDYYANSGDVNSPDGGGAASMALLTMWEITGDAKYRDKLKWKVDTSSVPTSAWLAGLADAMGLNEAIVNYYDLSGGYDKARQRIARSADFTVDFTPRAGQAWPFESARTCGEAWRITRDDRYRRHVVKLIEEYQRAILADPRVTMAPKDWPGGGFAFELQNMDFNNLFSLPFALWAAQGGQP